MRSRRRVPAQLLFEYRSKGRLNLDRRPLDVLLRLRHTSGIKLLQVSESRLSRRWRIPVNAFELWLQGRPDDCANTACGTPGSDGVGTGVVCRRVPGPQANAGQRASLATRQCFLGMVGGGVFDFCPQAWHRAGARGQYQREAPVLRCSGKFEWKLRPVGVPAANTAQNARVPHERTPAEACNLHS